MTEFLIYIIRWAVVLTMLYSLYGLFMKRETLHSINRLVLLVILVSAMLLPLVQVETREANVITEIREAVEMPLSTVDFGLRPNDAHGAPTTNPTGRIAMGLIAIYIIGVVIAWLRYVWSLASLLRLIRQSRPVSVGHLPQGVKVVAHPAITTPCSWMRWVMLSPDDAQILMQPGEAGQGLLRHELAHIRYGHSFDMLLCELTCCMLWPVPFVWMLRQDLRDVHEFQADRRVLRSGIDENEYQLLLIRKATSTGLQPVVNALNQSPIKRRFQMMYKKPSRRWVALKAAYLLPLAALALVAFARPQTMSEIERHVEQAAPAVAQTVKATVKEAVAVMTGTADDDATLPAETVAAEDNEVPMESEEADGGHVAADTTRIVGTDSNLVAADLRESGDAAVGTAQAKSAVELLDSTMQAVGARKIAEGTYVGHFQPSLDSDTVRIAQATILDRQSRQTDGHRFSQHADRGDAYNVTLNAETRKDRTGYYIRYLRPVSSKLRNYDRKAVDPKLLSTDSVLTKRGYLPSYYPVAIERSKKETRVFMYAWSAHDLNATQMASLKNDSEQNIFKLWQMHICDKRTNDRYMLRSLDDSYLRFVKKDVEPGDTSYVYQVCLVFPPLGGKVDEVSMGVVTNSGYQEFTNSFSIKALPHRGRIITN